MISRIAAIASLCALVAGCSKSNPDATPNGTTVLSWTLDQSDRASIRSAKQSERSVKDIDYVAKPTDDTEIKLAVHLETATVVFAEDEAEVTHTAPIKLEVKVSDNGDYTLHDGKCMGPNYELAAPGEAPRDMILHCVVKARKPGADVGFTLYAYGDGRIDDGVAHQTTITIK